MNLLKQWKTQLEAYLKHQEEYQIYESDDGKEHVHIYFLVFLNENKIEKQSRYASKRAVFEINSKCF